MEIDIETYLKFREQVLIDYSKARKEFMRMKGLIEEVNQVLRYNGIKNFEHFNGDFDLWWDLYHVTLKEKIEIK